MPVPIPEAWAEKFPGEPAPAWLGRFAADPEDALDGLLTGRLHLGHLNVAARDLLLADWVERLGDTGDFRARLDAALAGWIARHWGRLDYLPPASLAVAWQSAANAIAFAAPRLPGAATGLRRHFGEREAFLGVLSVAPSRDPLGAYLGALAANQPDAQLAPFWDWLCDLPQGVPLHHTRFALEGVAGLPNPSGERCAEIGAALLRLGRALRRWTLAEFITEQDAQREWQTLAHWCQAAFPFPEPWRDFATREAEALTDPLPKPLLGWLRAAFGLPEPVAEKQEAKAARGGAGWIPIEQWVKRAARIREQFGWDFNGALDAANELLDEQRKIENPYFVVRSLCNFANRVRQKDRPLALAWAEEAHRLDPANPYTWTTLAEALFAAGQNADAEAKAREASQRFPRNAFAQNTCAKLLQRNGKPEEAASVYRATIQRFPDDVVARAGLADVLKALDRLDEAEAVYRETVELFPDNVVARNGLADVLKALNRLDEAEAVYREVLDLFGDDQRQRVVAHTGLAGVLREQGRFEEAMEQVEAALALDPNDTFARTERVSIQRAQAGQPPPAKAAGRILPQFKTVAELVPGPLSRNQRRMVLNHVGWLRKQARAAADTPGAANPESLRQRAAEILAALLRQHPDDERVLAQQCLLSLDLGDLDAASRQLEQALALRPNAPRLLALRARVDRLRARRDVERLLPDADPRVLEAPRRLRQLRPELRPVTLLQAGLGYLALTDGELRQEKAAEEFGKLHRWVTHRLDPQARAEARPAAADEDDESGFAERETGVDGEFNAWWGKTLKEGVFDLVKESGAPEQKDVPRLADVVESNARLVELLEDNYVGRLAARAEWDPTEPVTV